MHIEISSEIFRDFDYLKCFLVEMIIVKEYKQCECGSIASLPVYRVRECGTFAHCCTARGC